MNVDLKYLTVPEVRDILRMSENSIRKHIRNGDIVATKCGTKWFVSPSDLKTFIERNKNTNKQ